jgi:hypothetical protein
MANPLHDSKLLDSSSSFSFPHPTGHSQPLTFSPKLADFFLLVLFVGKLKLYFGYASRTLPHTWNRAANQGLFRPKLLVKVLRSITFDRRIVAMTRHIITVCLIGFGIIAGDMRLIGGTTSVQTGGAPCEKHMLNPQWYCPEEGGGGGTCGNTDGRNYNAGYPRTFTPTAVNCKDYPGANGKKCADAPREIMAGSCDYVALPE